MSPRRSWNPSDQSALAAALSEPETMPLGQQLSGVPTDAEVRRMWQRVSGSGRAPRRRPLHFALALTAAAALLCAVTLVFWLRAERTGPLLAGDAPLPATLQPSGVASTVVLSDGSRIRLEPEARLDILGNDKRTFVTTLRHGKALFEVEPGGPRRWVIEAGLVSVEVVGTIFSVSREEGSVTVTVEHGVVLVRGEIAGAERRLTAGQSLVARAEPRARVGEAPKAPDRALEPATPPAAHKLSLDELPEEAAEELSLRGSAGDSRGAPPSAAPTLPSPPPSAAPAQDAIDAVLSAADAARRSGDVARAAALYEQAAEKASPGDARRGMAALSYARLATSPARAAALLEASQGSMPPALAEAALAHLAEAHGNAGHAAAAQAAARRYLETYPHHPRAEKVKRWLSGP